MKAVKYKKQFVRKLFIPMGLTVEKHKPTAMIDYLERYYGRKNLVGVEIGTLTGWNAYDILKLLPMKKLYLIDPYVVYEGFNDYGEQEELTWIKNFAVKLLERFGDKKKFVFDYSNNAVKDFEDKSLDFVYIDGNHTYEFVKQDILNYYPKLKIGGVMGGDDYIVAKQMEGIDCGVVKAVNELFGQENIQFKDSDWWVIKK